jgi:signal transduction histidine kinase
MVVTILPPNLPEQGTGLGLSMSYDIIKGHGGDFTVKTTEDESAEFIIQLPL